jgi:hypothetical protein
MAGQNGILKHSFTNGMTTTFANGGLLNGAVGLAFDASGNLFVANQNNTIARFSPDGTGAVFAATGLANPMYLAFDPVPEPSTGMIIIASGLMIARRRRISI